MVAEGEISMLRGCCGRMGRPGVSHDRVRRSSSKDTFSSSSLFFALSLLLRTSDVMGRRIMMGRFGRFVCLMGPHNLKIINWLEMVNVYQLIALVVSSSSSFEEASHHRRTLADGHSRRRRRRRVIGALAWKGARILSQLVMMIIAGILLFLVCFYIAASPPMQLFYEISPPASEASVYVPGGGFSGFWMHLGYLQSFSKSNLREHDFYCYSSGCLAVLLAFLETPLDQVIDVGFDLQGSWANGELSRYDIIDKFFDEVTKTPDLSHKKGSFNGTVDTSFLSNIKVLVTSVEHGVVTMEEGNTIEELRDHIIKTTWVPYITGWGMLSDHKDVYFDGGFSRRVHPACTHRLDLPLLTKEMLFDTFNPGLSRDAVHRLWDMGQNFEAWSIPRDDIMIRARGTS